MKELADESSSSKLSDLYTFGQIVLGSIQPQISISQITQSFENDPAFTQFLPRLNKNLSHIMTIENEEQTSIKLNPNALLRNYKFSLRIFNILVPYRLQKPAI